MRESQTWPWPVVDGQAWRGRSRGLGSEEGTPPDERRIRRGMTAMGEAAREKDGRQDVSDETPSRLSSSWGTHRTTVEMTNGHGRAPVRQHFWVEDGGQGLSLGGGRIVCWRRWTLISESRQLKLGWPGLRIRTDDQVMYDGGQALVTSPGMGRCLARRRVARFGELSAIQGQLSAMRGELSAIQGKLSAVRGQLSAIQGELSATRGQLPLLDSGTHLLDGATPTRQPPRAVDP